MATTIPKTMLAATVVEYNEPLELFKDIPVPTPQGSELLVKVKASSLCMSDIAGWMGHLGAPLPYCAGHEPVGIVVALGKDASSEFKIGDRVGFMPASRTCQNCAECTSGNHRYCDKRTNVGFDGPYGGFSEYALADPVSTVKIPEAIADDLAAPLLCAGVTAYGAVRKVTAHQPVGTAVNIIGCGGVGHIAIQYAVAMGYTVNACKSCAYV
ncbi:hypothetical protein LTR10_020893 [Elasticomyces elasticus]|uniref:Alcohol dehydrogenase-like N-terminal domain-containing protein n=1 Tax=Exophiala sideris TaxID=1016849 RepID=A0ABR0J090_9EURO|nr:hypothetical protein LTR10_020893 [Elasticomyces elasticus]KAK5023394.1 hypothetical protein LTS07_009269 [Exophiala sideris]KAK5028230.1 hypothetical protein LTR13_009218 [Exophiala sideris]KAK5052888.1 hypothetical protein LTR69_009714 [Exophiala sideris]KAK5178499.1 hypothetical protein LTR44_009124 [Eurotiomycetes sp. CCFEE 6388]